MWLLYDENLKPMDTEKKLKENAANHIQQWYKKYKDKQILEIFFKIWKSIINTNHYSESDSEYMPEESEEEESAEEESEEEEEEDNVFNENENVFIIKEISRKTDFVYMYTGKILCVTNGNKSQKKRTNHAITQFYN